MNILSLSLTGHWFREILSGRKKNEYRRYKYYWTKRLMGKDYTHILFTNGYGDHRPQMLVEYKRLAKCFKWFDGHPCYNLILGKIIMKRNIELLEN